MLPNQTDDKFLVICSNDYLILSHVHFVHIWDEFLFSIFKCCTNEFICIFCV